MIFIRGPSPPPVPHRRAPEGVAPSRPLLTACDSVFAAWRQRGAGHRYGRVQSFVTRYRAVGLEAGVGGYRSGEKGGVGGGK